VMGFMERSEKIGFYSISVNLVLVAIKLFLSVLSGSVALLADAIHSSTDVISSATVFAGIKISKRTSKGFPHGLYQVENFVSLLSSMVERSGKKIQFVICRIIEF
jgi:divalent metal cation (Fe/Co/Zn/Cd) transporter